MSIEESTIPINPPTVNNDKIKLNDHKTEIFEFNFDNRLKTIFDSLLEQQ